MRAPNECFCQIAQSEFCIPPPYNEVACIKSRLGHMPLITLMANCMNFPHSEKNLVDFRLMDYHQRKVYWALKTSSKLHHLLSRIWYEIMPPRQSF